MEENDNLNMKMKTKILTSVHIINKRQRNTKRNKIILYNFLSIIFLFLLVLILIFILENKKIKNQEKKEKQISEVDNNTINGDNIYISKNLFQYKVEDFSNTDLKPIHISYSLDNKLIFPTLISMLSGLENKYKDKNIIIYHLLLSHDFIPSKVEIFETLKKNYEVKINYYIIPTIFSSLNSWTNGTDCVYYKVLLPIMFPNLKRIIYLDGDTLIRKDISEMYNYPFGENYILGFPFYMAYIMDKYEINATHYINGGCLLFNIEKIRKDKKDVDLLQFTIKNNSILDFREQDSINYIFYPNIGFLPLKYGIYMIGSEKTFKSLSEKTRSPLNLTEGYEAVKDPSIVHFSCCWPKIWTEGTKNLFNEDKICQRYQKEFYDYAKKTEYYSEIFNSLFHNS